MDGLQVEWIGNTTLAPGGPPLPWVLQEGLLTVCLSTTAVSVLLSGVPCPIIIAWAIGKLYYENKQ